MVTVLIRGLGDRLTKMAERNEHNGRYLEVRRLEGLLERDTITE
jgi:hypothetical protein